MNNTFKKICLILAASALIASCATGRTAGDIKALDFVLVNEVFGYGQDTTKVVINVGAPVLSSSLSADTFTVTAKVSLPPGAEGGTIPIGYDGPRQVTAAYASDDGEGFVKASQGQYIVLELAHGRVVQEVEPFPGFKMKTAIDTNGASTLGYFMSETVSMGTNIVLILDYKVSQNKAFTLASGGDVTGVAYTKSAELRPNEAIPGEINPLVNLFVPGRYNEPSGDYVDYSFYDPKPAGPVPLVVWLHGAGEGRNGFGVQNQNVLRANEEAVAWVKPENQAVRPAYVLVPQSPSYGWAVLNNAGDTVKKLIDELLVKYPNIDKNRIYIAGDSMGGFGTFYMISTYPNFFAAAMTCPGGADFNNPVAGFTPKQLANIGQLPIWNVSVVGDSTMPTQMEAAFKSLYAAGANVRWTLYPSADDVEVYGNAHWAWVPLLSNLPKTNDKYMYDGKSYRFYRTGDQPGQSIMDWLFSQVKK